MTTGILLRRLQGDMNLEGVTHVVVDEVHERSIDSDFLLLLLKRVMRVRSDLKVILMRYS
jgi:HrpA-like RNA helicase